MPSLKILRGPEPGLEVELVKETIRIGRGRSNEIIIQDNEVSRYHCRMVRVLDDYEIHDLNSTNGTFVDGTRLDESGWLLHHGSIVELGDSITLEYIASDLATSPPDMSSGEQRTFRNMYLVINQASREKPELYRLDRNDLTLGRETNNDIILHEIEVSRHHLRLILGESGYIIEDLNTMNGTYLNDRRLVNQRALNMGDVIRIGKNLQMWYTDNPKSVLDSLKAGEEVSLALAEPLNDSTTQSTRQYQVQNPGQTRKISDEAAMALDALEDHIFLSHARAEWRGVAGDLYEYLHRNGVKVWSDYELEPDTEQWTQAIEQAQSESKCLLAIISPQSLRASHVQRSIRFFLAREKPVLLLRYGNIKRLPMMINNMPAVTYDVQEPQRSFRTLLAELQKLS